MVKSSGLQGETYSLARGDEATLQAPDAAATWGGDLDPATLSVKPYRAGEIPYITGVYGYLYGIYMGYIWGIYIYGIYIWGIWV